MMRNVLPYYHSRQLNAPMKMSDCVKNSVTLMPHLNCLKSQQESAELVPASLSIHASAAAGASVFVVARSRNSTRHGDVPGTIYVLLNGNTAIPGSS